MTKPLTMTARAMAHIDAIVRAAGADECLGLLASRASCDEVSAVALLPARVSRASAEASPQTIRKAAEALSERGLRTRGLWHSHGDFEVFHSSIDHDTIHRLLPAMAVANFERDMSITAPVVQGADTAAVPLADGRLLSFTLHGAPVPGTDISEPASWESVTTSWLPSVAEPAGVITASGLQLTSGRVSVRLRAPTGASLVAAVTDLSTHRLARVYSLVVNAKGHRYAQYLQIVEMDSDREMRLVDCAIVVVANGVHDVELGDGSPIVLE